MRIDHRHLAVLALDEFVPHARTQRAGPVEGQHGDDVLKAGGPEHAQILAHARTFHLKDAVRVAAGVKIIGLGVGKRQVVQIRRGLSLKADVVQRILDQGHGLEAQKVEFDQPGLFGHGTVELGHKFAAFAQIEGQILLHGLVRNHQSGGVGGGVAGQAFQTAGGIQQMFDLGIFLIEFFQVRFLIQSLLDGHFQVVGHQLGDAVRFRKGHAQRPTHVAHHALGLHGSECGDLGHRTFAIGIYHMADHVAAAAFAEVHVNIGQGYALVVQKAFKEQIVGQGVQVGDAQGPGRQRTGRRTAPRPYRDVVILGPVDKFLHNEEITGKAHFQNNIELVLEAFAVALRVDAFAVRVFFQSFFQALFGQAAEFGLHAGPFWQLVDREVMVAEIQLHIAGFSNAHGVGQGFGHMGKGFFHLFDGFVVEFVRSEAHALGITHCGLGLDAEQHLMGVGVVGVEVVAVVGGHQRQAGGFGNLQQGVVDHVLFGQAVGLQLQIKIAGIDGSVFPGQTQGLVHVPGQDGAGNFAGDAGRKAGQALGVAAQHILVHARLVVKAVQKTVADQLDQIVIAQLVSGQQNQVVAAARQFRGFVRMIMADVDLAAENGLDAELLAGRVEIRRAEHIAVVGDGAGGHAVILGAGAEILDADGAVQQAVFGMAMQMNKVGHGSS